MMHNKSLFLLFACLIASSCGFELHVAPHGNDINDGSASAPVRSLERARNLIREIKAKNNGILNEAMDVYIKNDEFNTPHYLERTFTLTGEDSASSRDHPITYRSHPSNTRAPIVSGGKVITGWSKYAANPKLWMAKVPGVANGTYNPMQLWVNDQRRPRSRLPSLDGLFYWTKTLAAGNTDRDRWGFGFNPADPIKMWQNIEDVNVIMYHSWTASRHFIAEIVEQNHTVVFKNPTGNPLGNWMDDKNGPSGHRYYVENVFEGLDEPTEWYLNRKTGVVYYYPAASEDMTKAATVLSNLDTVVELHGSEESLVENVNLEGIEVAHSEWHCPNLPQPCDGQSASFLSTAAIHVVNARSIQIKNTTLTHTGSYGIWLHQNATDVVVDDLYTQDLGAGGVRIGTDSFASNSGSHSVINSRILDGGYVFPEGTGVFIQQSSYNTISHNEIAYLRYSGVAAGWVWGYATPSKAHDNKITYNHIHHIGLGVLSDMAGIYTLGISPGTIIDHNLIHDVYTYNYGGWGLYPDEGTSETVWTNNIVYDLKCSGLHQHYGLRNNISNNIFAEVGWFDAAIRTDPLPNPNSLDFNHNIVYVTNASLFTGDWAVRSNNNFTFSSNVYFSTENNYKFGDNLDFAAWKALHKDENSVLADPLFVNLKQNNFKLENASPALKLGFQQIDISEVGPRM